MMILCKWSNMMHMSMKRYFHKQSKSWVISLKFWYIYFMSIIKEDMIPWNYTPTKINMTKIIIDHRSPERELQGIYQSEIGYSLSQSRNREPYPVKRKSQITCVLTENPFRSITTRIIVKRSHRKSTKAI